MKDNPQPDLKVERMPILPTWKELIKSETVQIEEEPQVQSHPERRDSVKSPGHQIREYKSIQGSPLPKEEGKLDKETQTP